MNYMGGMMTTWNKFCFTGGLLEASVTLPGTDDVECVLFDEAAASFDVFAHEGREDFLGSGNVFELDLEQHIATPEELSQSPFPVYVGKQVLGDLVLVPKRSCHQVVNSGGITVKMSWSRMTVNGLVTAFHHELPIYRR